jgi:Zn-dependent peptidase ImmA (M78 family)
VTYVPWPDNRFVRHLERAGHRLRSRLALSAFAALDPLSLIGTYDEMHTADLVDLFGSEHPGMDVLRAHSQAWSAIAYREKPGPWLIVSNPWHAETRRRASMMEEVAHIVLEHKPTRLEPCELTGLPKRTYTRSKEKEAYGVAGAALVPFNGLVPLLRNGDTAETIAARYGVSVELANMRINVTGARKVAA